MLPGSNETEKLQLLCPQSSFYMLLSTIKHHGNTHI